MTATGTAAGDTQWWNQKDVSYVPTIFLSALYKTMLDLPGWCLYILRDLVDCSFALQTYILNLLSFVHPQGLDLLSASVAFLDLLLSILVILGYIIVLINIVLTSTSRLSAV